MGLSVYTVLACCMDFCASMLHVFSSECDACKPPVSGGVGGGGGRAFL